MRNQFSEENKIKEIKEKMEKAEQKKESKDSRREEYIKNESLFERIVHWIFSSTTKGF